MEKVIAKKFKSFLESITDNKVKDLVRKNTIITGGCFVSLWNSEEVNDYDLYLRDEETAMAIAEYYVKMRGGPRLDDFEVKIKDDSQVSVFIRSSGVLDTPKPTDDRPKFYPVYFTSNAITLTHKMQIILRFYGEPEDIHKNYDFVHCTNYWDSNTGKVTMNIDAMDAIMNKKLHYRGSKYPICSVIRSRKFIKRGWNINAGQYLKMCMQITDLDLTDIDVLEDQLVGVDAAYFNHLIEEVRISKETGSEIDNTYIVNLIDKVFD